MKRIFKLSFILIIVLSCHKEYYPKSLLSLEKDLLRYKEIEQSKYKDISTHYRLSVKFYRKARELLPITEETKDKFYLYIERSKRELSFALLLKRYYSLREKLKKEKELNNELKQKKRRLKELERIYREKIREVSKR